MEIDISGGGWRGNGGRQRLTAVMDKGGHWRLTVAMDGSYGIGGG
jgi:hypothetical protein